MTKGRLNTGTTLSQHTTSGTQAACGKAHLNRLADENKQGTVRAKLLDGELRN